MFNEVRTSNFRENLSHIGPDLRQKDSVVFIDSAKF